MAKEVETRVVQMKFDNKQFQKNINETLSSLEELDKSLKFEDASKGFDKIAQASRNVSLGVFGDAVDSVKFKFNALEIAAITAITNITNKAINAGERLVKSLSVDNIASGWQKFEDTTTSVGTLISQGFKMDDVEKQLDRLNWFTDETSYNFTDMVSNIGKFTAAGQNLEDSVTAMEGIANWAALSGANAQKASQAMYQLSQAMGKGALKYDDYKSIQNVNMDTREFRQTALDAAVALGTLQKTAKGTYKTLKGHEFDINSFSTYLSSDQWLTSDVMIKSFKKYSSAVEQLYEYAEEHNVTASEAITELGNSVDSFGLKAFKAAQEARTWTDVIASIKDAVSSGWKETFENIIGNYEEAKNLFTAAANVLYEIFAEGGNKRNSILEIWKEGGGRSQLLDGILAVLISISEISKSISEIWRKIFLNGMDEEAEIEDKANKLLSLTERFRSGAYKLLQFVEVNIPNIQSLFEGIFSVIKAVKDIVFDIIKTIFPQTNAFQSLSQVILSLLGAVGRLLTKFAEWIKEAEIVRVVTTAIGKVLSFLGNVILTIIAVLSLISSRIKEVVYRIKQVDPLRKLLAALSTVFYICAAGVMYAIESIKQFIKVVSTPELAKESDNPIVKALTYIYNAFVKIGQGVLIAIAGIRNFLSSIKGLSITEKVKALVDKVKELKDGIVDNLFGKSEEGARSLTDVMQSLLDKIHAFLGEVTLGKIVALAFTVSLLGVAGALAKLLNSASSLFGNVTGFFKTLKAVITKTYAKSIGILNVAEAFGILSASLWLLSRIPEGKLNAVINEVIRLIGVLMGFYAGLMALKAILKAVKLDTVIADTANNFSKIMFSLAAALAAISVAMVLLQNVTFSKDLVKNLLLVTAVVGLLGGIAMIMTKFTAGKVGKSVASSIAILALAISMAKIVEAIGGLTKIDTRDLKGLGETLTPIFVAIGALAVGLGQIKISTVVACLLMIKLIQKFIPELQTVGQMIMSSNFEAVLNKLATVLSAYAIIEGIEKLIIFIGVFGKNIGKAMKGISMLIIAVGALIGFCYYISSLNIRLDPSIFVLLLEIGAIIAGIEFLSKYIPEKTRILKFAVSMVLLTGAMGLMLLLAKAAKKLDILSWDALVPLIVVSGIIALIERMSAYTSTSKTLSLIVIVGGIVSLMGMLVALTLIPTNQILAASAAMALVMLGIGNVLEKTGKIISSVGSKSWIKKLVDLMLMLGAIVGLCAVMFTAAVSMKMILESGASWSEMTAAALSIVAIISAIGIISAALVKLSSNEKAKGFRTLAGFALVLLAACPMLVSIAASLSVLSNAGEGVMQGAYALSLIIAAIGVMSAAVIGVSSSGAKGFKTLAGFAIVLASSAIPIYTAGIALSKLGEIPTDRLEAASKAINWILVIIAGGTALLSLIGPTTSGMGLLVLAAGLAAVGIALYTYAGAFSLFADSLIQIQNAVVNDPLGTAVSQIKTAIVGLEEEKEAIKQSFYDLGVYIVEGFKQGIDDGLLTLQSTSETLAKVPYETVEQLNGIASPSTKFIAIGKYIIAGLAGGLLEGVSTLINVCKGVSDSVSTPIITNAAATGVAVQEITDQTATNVVDIVDEEIPKVAQIAQDTEKTLVSDQETTDDKLETETHNTTEKQKTFWSNMWDSICTKAQQALNTIFGWITGSNDYAKQINEELQKGLDEGWNEWTSDKLWSTLKGVGEKAGKSLGLDLSKISLDEVDKKVQEYKDKFNLGDVFSTDDLNLDEYTSSIMDLTSGLDTASGAATKTKSAFESLNDTISGQMDIFSKFNDETSISAQDMLDNMKSQIFGINSWANNLARLAMRGLDAGLLQQLGDLGPQGYAKVAAFAEMTDEQLQEANFLYTTAMKLPGYAAEEVSSSYQYAGEMAIKGYSNALDKFKGLINTYEIGETSLTELAKAIEQTTTKTVAPTAKKSAKKVTTSIEEEINEPKGAEIVNNLLEGMDSSFRVSSKLDVLEKDARKVAKRINYCFKDETDQNSPSKLWFKFGENLLVGLANGISATSEMAEDSVSIVADSINSAMSIMETSSDFQPVMTPVLNLSEIQNGVNSMSSMMYGAGLAVSTNAKIEANVEAARAAQQQALYFKGVNDAINNCSAQIVDAIIATDKPMNVNVTLQGDSAGLFKMVRQENAKFSKINGYNPLTQN